MLDATYAALLTTLYDDNTFRNSSYLHSVLALLDNFSFFFVTSILFFVVYFEASGVTHSFFGAVPFKNLSTFFNEENFLELSADK